MTQILVTFVTLVLIKSGINFPSPFKWVKYLIYHDTRHMSWNIFLANIWKLPCLRGLISV